MNDRELLGLAAKAAGVELQPMEIKNVTEEGDDRFIGYMSSSEKCPRGWFNPLTDDGDALRLAVKLDLTVNCSNWCARSSSSLQWHDGGRDDPFAATRRAIVRAAAEIGKAMP